VGRARHSPLRLGGGQRTVGGAEAQAIGEVAVAGRDRGPRVHIEQLDRLHERPGSLVDDPLNLRGRHILRHDHGEIPLDLGMAGQSGIDRHRYLGARGEQRLQIHLGQVHPVRQAFGRGFWIGGALASAMAATKGPFPPGAQETERDAAPSLAPTGSRDQRLLQLGLRFNW